MRCQPHVDLDPGGWEEASLEVRGMQRPREEGPLDGLGAQRSTYAFVNSQGQPEKQTDQGGAFVTSDWLKLWIALVLYLELAQAVDDLVREGKPWILRPSHKKTDPSSIPEGPLSLPAELDNCVN